MTKIYKKICFVGPLVEDLFWHILNMLWFNSFNNMKLLLTMIWYLSCFAILMAVNSVEVCHMRTKLSVNIMKFQKVSLDSANMYILWGMKLSFVTDLVCWHLWKHLTIWCQVLPFEQFPSAYFSSSFLVSCIPLRPCLHLIRSSFWPELDPATRRNTVSLFGTKNYWKRKLPEPSSGDGHVCS